MAKPDRVFKMFSERCFLRFFAAVLLTFAMFAPSAPAKAAEPENSGTEAISVASSYRNAELSFRRSDYEMALSYVEKGLGIDPWYLPLWNIKIQSHIKSGQHDEALRSVRFYLMNVPDSLDAKKFAVEAIVLNNIPTAEKEALLTDLFKRQDETSFPPIISWFFREKNLTGHIPLFLGAWQKSGVGLNSAHDVLSAYHAKEYQKAALAFEQAEKGPFPAPLRPFLYFILGKALITRGEDQPSLGYLQKAMEYGYTPKSDVIFEIGNIHYLNDRYVQAAETWESAWRSAPNPDVWVELAATARLRAEQPDKAVQILEAGLKAFPRASALQGRYMLALSLSGRTQDLAAFEKRLTDMKASQGLAYGRILVAQEKGETNAARKEFDELKRTEPVLTERRTGDLTLENWLAEMGYNTKLDIDAGEAARFRDLGWTSWQKKNYREALKHWEKALQLGLPRPQPFVLNVATRLFEVNMSGDALRLLKHNMSPMPVFGYVQHLADAERWYAVPSALSGSANGEYEPWASLYLTYSSLRMGYTDNFQKGLRTLSRQRTPTGELAFTSVNVQGEFITRRLKPDSYTKLFGELVDLAIRQKDLPVVAALLALPQWQSLPAARRGQQAQAFASEAIRQNDFDFLKKLMNGPLWKRLPASAQKNVTEASANLAARQGVQAFVEFMGPETPANGPEGTVYTAQTINVESFFKSSRWQGISAAEKQKLLAMFGKMVIEQNDTNFFPLLMQIANQNSLPPGLVADLLSSAGFHLCRSRNLPEAEKYVTQALRKVPEHGDANMINALLAKYGGNDAAAATWLQKGEPYASPAVKGFVIAEMASLEGEREDALVHFREYLKIRPEDDEVRYRAVVLLNAQRLYSEAKAMMAPFEKRYTDGEKSMRTYLALCRQLQGDLKGSENIWRRLSWESRNNLNYLNGLANVLLLQGNVENVFYMLSDIASETLDPSGILTLAQASLALQNHASALKWAELGLDAHPKNEALLRIALNAAYEAGRMPKAERYAEEYLKLDKDSIGAQSIYSQSLIMQEKWDKVKVHNAELLAGNRLNERALTGEVERIKFENAKKPSKERVREVDRLDRLLYENYGHNPGYAIRSAISAAGVGDFRRSVALLNGLLRFEPEQAVAVLFYPQLSLHYEVDSVLYDKFFEDLDMLSEAGYRYASLSDIESPDKNDRKTPDGPSLLLLVGNMKKETAVKVDKLLDRLHINACLVVDEGSLVEDSPSGINPAFLKELQESGRWEFILSDYSWKKIPRNGDGRKASFWGQPMWLGKRLENEEEMYRRWSSEMARLKKMAGDAGIKIGGWLIPAGDYGQLAAEVGDDARNAFRRAIKDNFSLGFASTHQGYWLPHEDTWRVPVRYVYTGLDTKSLLRDLEVMNPVLNAAEQLKKVEKWRGN